MDQTPDLPAAELAKLADQAAKSEVITVTGSALERRTLTTPAPITILTRDQLLAAGRATLGDILQQQPANANGANAAINTGDGSTRINLRGLGANRTLTLINGRRAVAGGTGADDSADFSAIPLALVERVEILKDGASAIYGSDAVGGVVNVITRNDFEGTEAQLYTSSSQRRDGFGYDANLITGQNFDDHRGNVTVSAGFHRQYPIFAGDRAFSRQDHDFDYDTRTPFPVGSPSSPGGRIDAFNIDLDGDGVGDKVDLCGAGVRFCTRTASGGFRPFDMQADAYNFQPIAYLYTPSTNYHLYGAGNYKLTPSVTAFYEASYADRTSSQQLAPGVFSTLGTGLVISRDSLYNPTGGDVLGDTRRLVELGPRRFSEDSATVQAVTGVRGTIPDASPVARRWKWEVSYAYGRTSSSMTTSGDLVLSKLASAVGPSFRDATNTPTCGTPDAPIPGCVPLDVLGPAGAIDPRARDAVTYTGVSTGYDAQHTVLATAHGQVVELPHHGDLSVAVGVDYRTQSGGAFPDSLTASGGSQNLATPAIEGSSNVVEGYGELSIVPFAGDPIVQWLELDLAARGFHYGSFGNGATWKVGGLFRTVNGIALRGTYSTAFRAPSVSELFFTQTFDSPLLEDPCDTRPPSAGGATITLDPVTAAQCQKDHVPVGAGFGTSQARVKSGGNPDLQPETARTLTAGVVIEPPQVPGLALTADYWHIALSRAIQSFTPDTVLSSCYQGGVQSFCDLIHRDPQQGFAIDLVDATLVNVGAITTSGVDISLAYNHTLVGFGRLSTQADLTYLLRYNLDDSTRIVHLRGVYDGGVNPSLKARLAAGLQHPSGFGGGVNFQYIGGFKECKFDDCADGEPSRDVEAWYRVDLNASYAFHDPIGRTTVSVGINNVLDRPPALIYFGNEGDSDGTAYDLFGRFFYARLTQRF